MKFLIIGYGSIGRRHFRNLLDLGEKDILFFRTQQSTLSDDEIASFIVESDLESALDHNPDAVIIANPTAFHLKTAMQVAQRGCHILLEKPISHTSDHLDEFISIIDQMGCKVLVGYQFRYHPNLIKIKEIIDKDIVGNILYFRSHWGEYLPQWHTWEDYRHSYSARRDLGGGVVLTLSHNFDYLRWLFGEGEVVSSVLGYNSNLSIDVEDTAEIILRFSNEVFGSLHLNYTQIPPKHSLEIIGTKGSIFWDYHQNSILLNSIDFSDNVTTKTILAPEGFDRNDMFIAEMENFIEVIHNREEPACSLSDGIAALDLALEALNKSQ